VSQVAGAVTVTGTVQEDHHAGVPEDFPATTSRVRRIRVESRDFTEERWRKSGTMGHVGFYMGETPDTISLLGGNQNDRVNIVAQPKSRLLGFRAAGP
jgi:hypothetical protein